MKHLKVTKPVIDDAVRRVIEMRFNRGLGIRVFKKEKYSSISRIFDEQEKIRKHRMKKAA